VPMLLRSVWFRVAVGAAFVAIGIVKLLAR
jgi:hypothetical protein